MTAEHMKHHVHLVIPCFRESRRLRPFLSDLCKECRDLGDVSILVVDDGSEAEEQARLHALVEEFRAEHAFVREMFALAKNVGKGGTVYAGWEQARGEPWLMFADADGSVPAREVARIVRLSRAESGPPHAWCASRVRMLGRKVERTWFRNVISHSFHWIVDLLLDLPAHDTQCGCKLVPREAFERTRRSLSLTGFAFDLDLIVGLREHGCEIVEVPVDWHEVPGGKLKLLRDPWIMLRDVLRVRKRMMHRRAS